MGAAISTICQSISKRRTIRQMLRGTSPSANGEKRQMASFGQASRMPPAAKPQPTAKGSAAHSRAMMAGVPSIAPTSAPPQGPVTSPARNAPSSVMSSRVVAEEQARDDARRQDQAEAEGEEELHRPVAPLVDQQVAEAMVADHHDGQQRHDGDADDEGDQQELLVVENCAGLAHGLTIAAGLEACQTAEDERVMMTRTVTTRLSGAFSRAPPAARRHAG